MTGIIDYGEGNLFSLKNALDFLGIKSFISSNPNELDEANRLILPGVGAFGNAMRLLSGYGLVDYLRRTKKPLLGICLGMQLLFDKSYEFGETAGLGLLKGEIIHIKEFAGAAQASVTASESRYEAEPAHGTASLIARGSCSEAEPVHGIAAAALRLPHMGWNFLEKNTDCVLSDNIYNNTTSTAS